MLFPQAQATSVRRRDNGFWREGEFRVSTRSIGSDAESGLREDPAEPAPIAARTRWLHGARAHLRVLEGGRAKPVSLPLTNPATPSAPDPVMVGTQKLFAVLLLIVGALGFAFAPLRAAATINAVLTVFFAAANVFKLMLVRRSLEQPCAITASRAEVASLRAARLPVFTILVPVYRESAVLRQLVGGIAALDYPEDRLDVKVLLEEDDDETRGALEGITLPPYIEVLTVPDIGPKGKPRACNHGLTEARGKYLVIYDAEDRPEPDQLRKVVVAFTKTGDAVVCLQAHLNYFNRTQNLLTRWFSAEYSNWFDQLLTGLQSYDLPIPLGGTSNHFVTARLRELGGWNAYNVTEDADLGMRIFRRGWKTAVVTSTTYEEANSRTLNWIRQRSRWAKGYMQTYLCHMRRPVQLYRELGLRAFVAFQLFFGGQTLCLLLNPFYWLITVLWFATRAHIIEIAFPTLTADVGVVGFFMGNAAFVLSTIAGCVGRRHYDDVKRVLVVPFYWLLMSVAAWKGLLQLFFKPYYWEKTTHGFSMFDAAAAQGHELREASGTLREAG